MGAGLSLRIAAEVRPDVVLSSEPDSGDYQHCGRAPEFAVCDRRLSRFAISECRDLRSVGFALS